MSNLKRNLETIWCLGNHFGFPVKLCKYNFLSFGPIRNMSVVVQVMAWCRTGDKPLPEARMTHFYETRQPVCTTTLSGEICPIFLVCMRRSYVFFPSMACYFRRINRYLLGAAKLLPADLSHILNVVAHLIINQYGSRWQKCTESLNLDSYCPKIGLPYFSRTQHELVCRIG